MVIYITDQISKAPSKLTGALYHPLEYHLIKVPSPTQEGEREK